MNKTFTTAKGIAYYPYISAPDTKFDEQGHYKVNLCLSEEDAQPVIEVIKQTVVEGIKALKKDKQENNGLEPVLRRPRGPTRVFYAGPDSRPGAPKVVLMIV